MIVIVLAVLAALILFPVALGVLSFLPGILRALGAGILAIAVLFIVIGSMS